MNFKEISAEAAVKLFKEKIAVQTAARVKVKGDDGKVREAFKTETQPLAAEHVLSAKDYGNKVTITTIDGQRYEAAKSAKDAKDAKDAKE